MFDKLTYYDQAFDAIDVENNEIKDIVFENCKFIDCNFKEASFCKCKFIDCCFKSSDLSLLNINGSSFSDVEFDSCKMTDINWTLAWWPSITLTSPIFFNHCDISFSSFYELKLATLSIINCKAQDTDFRGCHLDSADFTGTDLEKAEFMHTVLNNADFSNAINYVINPVENSLANAKFSFPEVVNLLHTFDIKIEGISG